VPVVLRRPLRLHRCAGPGILRYLAAVGRNYEPVLLRRRDVAR